MKTAVASPKLASAQNWADYLFAMFTENLGYACPFPIEPGLDAHGDHQLTIAGVVVPGDYRHKAAVQTALFVASKLASPIAHRPSLDWFDYPFELCGFIGYMHAEHYVADSDGFASWLDDFRRRPDKWTVEYIASMAG